MLTRWFTKIVFYSSTYAYLVIIYWLQIISPSLSDVKESILVRGHDKNEDSDNSPDELVKVAEEPKEKWDCESILSEYLCRKIIISLMFCDMRVRVFQISKSLAQFFNFTCFNIAMKNK